MSSIEKETIINFNMKDAEAEVYSCQPRIWSKCERLGLKPKSIAKDKSGRIISKTYMCPKKWIRINRSRVMTEDQKEELRKRFELARENKK